MTGIKRRYRRQLARDAGGLKHRHTVSDERRDRNRMGWGKADKHRHIEKNIYAKKRINKGRSVR